MISSCVFTAICVSLALSEELGQLFQSFIIMFLHLLWLQPFHESSRAAFSLFTGFPRDQVLPDQCPINEFTFNVSDTEEMEYPVMVALGYTSLEAKADFFCDMRRLAGEKILCGSEVMLLLLVTQLHRVAMRLYQALRPTKLFSTHVGNCWIGSSYHYLTVMFF